MTNHDRQQLRRVFHTVHVKMQDGAVLDTMEHGIATVIAMHPEYHPLLSSPDNIDREFAAEYGHSNPYLHMSLHLALHEQIDGDRPRGIRDVHAALRTRHTTLHDCEHRMLEVLSDTLWQSQRSGQFPDETAYLAALRALLR